ncbi:thiamine phosphate synthase [Parabacteroides sp. ZJ-118]|uniref:thiamine phosphate synthase n=1 Tax=Parabacteroides sp. ZJ-118 TaxID=2709398 RepID=UPI0013EB2671|nr:thiamine phosphate synthase [Parabacteroides sp. ZJ-118]
MNKLVVITTPCFFAEEAALIECLFAEGMSRLHLRKPDCERDELEGLLDKISPAYYDRIVLHDWFDLAEERALGGVHLNRRNPEAPPLYKGGISRSCHSLEEIVRYKPVCDYVFLSPIFPSISKEGYGGGFSPDGLRGTKGIIDDKVIALGGISPRTITRLKDIPFGGVAVLGWLWGNDPSRLAADRLIKQFKQLQVWL